MRNGIPHALMDARRGTCIYSLISLARPLPVGPCFGHIVENDGGSPTVHCRLFSRLTGRRSMALGDPWPWATLASMIHQVYVGHAADILPR